MRLGSRRGGRFSLATRPLCVGGADCLNAGTHGPGGGDGRLPPLAKQVLGRGQREKPERNVVDARRQLEACWRQVGDLVAKAQGGAT
jgi:hypothetical protein